MRPQVVSLSRSLCSVLNWDKFVAERAASLTFYYSSLCCLRLQSATCD